MKILGTRGSDLALTQSGHIAERLAACGTPTELLRIVTQGDRVTHLSLDKIEGKGFFTTEIEQALRDKRIDIAVHSLKDLPAEPAEGLCIAAIPTRQDVRDTLIIAPHAFDAAAPLWPVRYGAVIGTSAVRRKAQLLAHRPDLTSYDLRGNVPTRIQRLRDGRCDAIVLAEAGLRRLGSDLAGLHVQVLDPTVFVPAPGQGALALQCRSDDEHTRAALAALHHQDDAALVYAERGLLARLKAGCHVPLGAHAIAQPDGILMHVYFGGQGQGSGDLTGYAPARYTVGGAHPEEVAEVAFAHLQRTRQNAVAQLDQQHPNRGAQFVP